MQTNECQLTAEQIKKIEENRQKALLRRAEKVASRNLSKEPQVVAAQPAKLYTPAKRVIRGRCVVISRSKFEVQVGYHRQLIEIFQTLPTRLYDIGTKTWSFDFSDYDQIIKRTSSLKPDVEIVPLPQRVLTLFKAKSTKSLECDLSRLNPVLENALMPFQREGVCFGISHDGRVLIADDMGLGKTIQALGIANYYQEEWPLLIIAPSSMRYSWLEAIHMWLPSVKRQQIVVLNSGKDDIGKYKVYITSYDLMTRKEDDLSRKNFGVVIMDESHFLKNSRTARTKAAQTISQGASRVILLSGTPALSRPQELYSQIYMINKKLFSSFHEFGLRYCDGKKNPWGWDFTGESNTKELLLIMEDKIMIRRLKSDVIKQLPPKLRQMVLLDPTDIGSTKIMKHYSQILTQSKLKGMERRNTLLTYFQETSSVKSTAVCKYIEDLLEKGSKFLCFAHHRVMLDEICNTLDKKKCQYIRIDGNTPSESRKLQCDRFQQNDSVRVAVLSITAANAGLTFTAARLVLFAELYWNPGILTQAEDRVHRIGQEDSVHVQYLVASGTADDHLWLLIQNKLEVLNKVGLSKDNFRNADTAFVRSKKQNLDSFFAVLENDDLLECNNSESPTKKIKLL